jgi:hypothetical protein
MKDNLSEYKDKALKYLNIARRNAAFMFILFLVGIYGFLAWTFLGLYGTQPDETTIQAELKAIGIPKVDTEVAKKMEQLEDNSVSAQTLFDEARKNPFQE